MDIEKKIALQICYQEQDCPHTIITCSIKGKQRKVGLEEWTSNFDKYVLEQVHDPIHQGDIGPGDEAGHLPGKGRNEC